MMVDLPRPARRPFQALLAVLVVAGCSLVFTQPTVRVAGVRVASFGITSGAAELLVEVDNPNGYDLEIRGLDYVLRIEDSGNESGWRELSAGAWPDTVRLPSKDTARLVVNVPFDYSALGAALNAILTRGSIAYDVQGSTRVDGPTGEVHVPFRHRGRLKP